MICFLELPPMTHFWFKNSRTAALWSSAPDPTRIAPCCCWENLIAAGKRQKPCAVLENLVEMIENSVNGIGRQAGAIIRLEVVQSELAMRSR
ncbi:hypothetical protein X750_28305 [Mesorhizobium sp. LNJC394B00]|nr:hypothetical protein X750_28305 [Mesorhizobium sp. LNJC394B00]